MHIMIVAIGSTGDVQPMIVLSKELIRRGYIVTIAAFSTFSSIIESQGVGFFVLPGDAEHYIGNLIKPGANPFTYLSRLIAAFDHMITPLVNAVVKACMQADAIIGTFFGNSIRSIADSLSKPFIEVCYCPMYTTGDHCLPIFPSFPLGKAYNLFTYSLAHFLIPKVEKRYTYDCLQQMGMKPALSRTMTHPILNAYSAHVSPKPPEWTPNMHITGFLYENNATYTPSQALATFLRHDDPPIYIGFGSMTSGDTQKTMQMVCYALSKIHMRAILSTGWSDMDTNSINTVDLPDSIYLLNEFVPHQWLFERVKAVVHHGGAGTTYAGLRAGVPSMVIPFGSDQFFWGTRVYRLGCGPKPLSYKKMTGEKLAQRLLALCTPAYYAQARLLCDALAKENGIDNAANIVEDYIKKEVIH